MDLAGTLDAAQISPFELLACRDDSAAAAAALHNGDPTSEVLRLGEALKGQRLERRFPSHGWFNGEIDRARIQGDGTRWWLELRATFEDDDVVWLDIAAEEEKKCRKKPTFRWLTPASLEVRNWQAACADAGDQSYGGQAAAPAPSDPVVEDDRADPRHLPYRELQAKCVARGLKANGTSAQMAEALLRHHAKRSRVSTPGLAQLQILNLDTNSLSGTMPSNICNLIITGDLTYCDLSSNPFACPLPACGAQCQATCS
jgi:hypothetical protein